VVVAADGVRDRVGIGWRPELTAAIVTNLDRIDAVEIIADDLFDTPARELATYRRLAADVPVLLHGVSLGLASAAPADARRLDAMARVVGAVQPERWSEHLAFVRAGGLEIGHLAAPPRTAATIEGAARNLARARAVVGAPPLVENIATLIDPPGSDRTEADWIAGVLAASGCDLLLDLNNLHANSVNFGFDAADFLARMPLERVGAIHLAGGTWIAGADGQRRLLDDHLHDVPDPVYALLAEVAARAPGALTVVLERDGAYPPFGVLLAELERARVALAAGRARARRPAARMAS
jgi:uncharacterized protein (UPF0276 family)